MRHKKLRLNYDLWKDNYQKKLMERNNTSINLNISEINKTKTDEYKFKNPMDGKNMEYIKTEENEKKNDMPICSSSKNIFSQYQKHFPYKNGKLNKKNKNYKKIEKEENKQEEDSLNKIFDNKIINNDKYLRYKNIENKEDNKQKYLNRTLTSFYKNNEDIIGDIMYDKNNITNEKDNDLNLNDKAQKNEENLFKKFQLDFPKKNKNKNKNEVSFSSFINNNYEIQNKSISDNKSLLDSNETFEKEPGDIKEYLCLPLSKIKNNCNPRGYKWILIPPEIAPNQLKQEIGNCYMVSALEAISQKPYLLPYIFKGDFSSYQHKFKLTFKTKDGKPIEHIVLNNFPLEENELKYMKPKENEAFAIIFEKAIAGKKGGYKNSVGGKSCEVLDLVLGTTTKYVHNDNMKAFDPEKYIQYNSQTNVSDMDNKDIKKKLEKIKDSDNNMIEIINKIKNKDKKIESKKAFEEIREAEKEGGITTVSLNMDDGGHCYSVLGTYSEKNKKTGKIQDFIILKNPWRSGDDLKEKLNMPQIEEQINGFDEIKKINRNHYETGIFYMPREYFEGWFRSICICKPNYKEYFPKVYDTLNLYKDIYEFYNIDADKTFFESFHGNELIKTNIISKENLDILLKIVHHIKSDFNFVYKDKKLSTIWLDKNKDLGPLTDDKKKDFGFPNDYYFIMKNNTFIVNFVELKEKKEIKETDFNNAEVYSVGIICYKNRWNVIYPKVNKNPSKKKESLDLLVNPLRNDFDYMPIFDNDQKDFLKDSSINLIMDQLKSALNSILKSKDEINGFLTTNKYKKKTISIKTGWVDIFSGINLYSNEKEDGHYHTCRYGKTNTTNLFHLMGQTFKCNCYYIDNNIITKECNKYFIFQKNVVFHNYTYKINDIPKTCKSPYYDEYDLEKEKNNFDSIK